MRRTSFADMPCSIARALEVIGDWWTLLIIREAFFGSRRFGEFEKALGIAPNVLTARLSKLVDSGILRVEATAQNGKALSYRLTPAGHDLFPVLVALLQWGDRHAAMPEGAPVRIVERRTGQDIAPMHMQSASGQTLRVQDVMPLPGPGAGQAVRQRLQAVAERASGAPADQGEDQRRGQGRPGG
ncbi:transcriptional regulator [Aquabacterium lacunae]|uniref:Transcriptional regulator n=1 Tax=Aquabacterium lacunae TaxID=2528630 RepID=A0A4Q9H2R2_9BURK|nr:helix-turn-helix domain-containing protein [Aquabacterium lacunae]TBO32901.1 transcriptional regulator [Aquabacterium lacunae]